MKIKHRVIAGILALAAIVQTNTGVMAQGATDNARPQKVETAVKVLHDAEWYRRQERLWKEETERNPKNEEAWGNYYRAVNYRSWHENIPDIQERLGAIVNKMGKAIPDTYTYYIIKFHYTHDAGDCPEMAEAIRMRPDAVEDYPTFVSYLMQSGDEATMKKILTKWYNSGEYSSSLLNYAYNELIGLERDAVIFVHGDTPTFAKLILQYGKGIRPDVTIVNETFWLYNAGYRERIEKKLGLPSFAELVTDGTYTLNGDSKDVKDVVYRHLIDNTGRPVYFSSLMEMPKFTDKLYSEGLVIRYSEKPYDNLAMKRRNYEELYLTDYLRESFAPERYPASATPYSFNYIPCFKSLLDYYKRSGNIQRYNELHNLMTGIVKSIDVPEEERRKYYEEIDR
jgi:hypothetical protein